MLTDIQKNNIEYFIYVQMKTRFQSYQIDVTRITTAPTKAVTIAFTIPRGLSLFVPQHQTIQFKINDSEHQLDLTIKHTFADSLCTISIDNESDQFLLLQATHHVLCDLFNTTFDYLPSDKRAEMKWIVFQDEIRMYQPNRNITGHTQEQAREICREVANKLRNHDAVNQNALKDFSGRLDMVIRTEDYPWHFKITAVSLQEVFTVLRTRNNPVAAENLAQPLDMFSLPSTPDATEFDGFKRPETQFDATGDFRLQLEEDNHMRMSQ